MLHPSRSTSRADHPGAIQSPPNHDYTGDLPQSEMTREGREMVHLVVSSTQLLPSATSGTTIDRGVFGLLNGRTRSHSRLPMKA